ncbi:hypothetical protein [Allocoleopsis sp.]|uniref:hypothetical protein n=1 Tax=Allocoleopsis sp. TaxID=3088169 RepID=UPI002FD294B7
MHLPKPLPFTPGDLRLTFCQKALTFMPKNLTHPGQPRDMAVAKAIRTQPNTESLTRQSFAFCPLPSGFCYNFPSSLSQLERTHQ